MEVPVKMELVVARIPGYTQLSAKETVSWITKPFSLRDRESVISNNRNPSDHSFSSKRTY